MQCHQPRSNWQSICCNETGIFISYCTGGCIEYNSQYDTNRYSGVGVAEAISVESSRSYNQEDISRRRRKARLVRRAGYMEQHI